MPFATLIQRVRERLPMALTGGALLLVSSTVVNAGNYMYNLIMGRWLGPEAFADVSLIVTLFLVITFVTVALQTTTAKFAAVYIAAERPEANAALRRWLGRGAWLGGLVTLVVFVVGAPLWQRFFHTSSAWPFVIFAFGIPFYFVLGVERGMLQGQTHFGLLSVSYQVEMWARLGLGVGLVALGWSVLGAVGGLTLSLVVTWLVLRQRTNWRLEDLTQAAKELVSRRQMSWRREAVSLPGDDRRMIIRFAVPVVAALVGQILITNSDVLIVKHFFSPGEAGLYAALALIGRIVFFATWSVVMVLFPIVAQRHHQGVAHRYLLYAGLGIVLAISAPIVGAAFFVPELVVSLLFGAQYASIAPLLGFYALAVTCYALSNVVISYRLSLGNAGGSLLALAAGLIQVLALSMLHRDLSQVVFVLISVMGVLFCSLLLWDGWLLLKRQSSRSALSGGSAAD